MDAITRTIQRIVDESVSSALAPYAASLEQISAFLRGTGVSLPATAARGRRGRAGRPSKSEGSACAIIGCRRPVRSKGYCASHYLKRRNLVATHRLPSDWTDPGKPQSAKDIVLPRGRAGAAAVKGSKR